jgi:hypothetical protein
VLEGRTLLSATAATHLVVTTQPPVGVAVGAEFGVVVAAEDDAGNVDASDNQAATVSLASNPAGAMLGGNLTAPLANGFATFTGLTVNQAGGGDALQLTSGSLTAATTRTFDVVDGPVASVVLAPIPYPFLTATATTTVSAPPGDVVSLTYVWAVNGAVVQVDAGTQSLSDTLDLNQLFNTFFGDAITVIVTPEDSPGSGTPTVATTILGIEHHFGVGLEPASPTVGQTLSALATVQLNDDSDNPLVLTYVWYLGGTPVQTTTTQSLVDTLDLSTFPNARKGEQVTVMLTPTEAGAVG